MQARAVGIPADSDHPAEIQRLASRPGNGVPAGLLRVCICDGVFRCRSAGEQLQAHALTSSGRKDVLASRLSLYPAEDDAAGHNQEAVPA